MSGLSAPSLQDARFVLCIGYPLLNLPRVIDDVREEFRSARVAFDEGHFQLVSTTHLGKIDYFKLSFKFDVIGHPDSTKLINITSTKFAMTEELTLIDHTNLTEWEHGFSLREFLRQFRSVRVLRVLANLFMQEVDLYLQQDDGEAIFPVLEEIEVSITRLTRYSDEEYQHRVAEALAVFEPFVSARERVGHLVRVYHCE